MHTTPPCLPLLRVTETTTYPGALGKDPPGALSLGIFSPQLLVPFPYHQHNRPVLFPTPLYLLPDPHKEYVCPHVLATDPNGLLCARSLRLVLPIL